MKITDINEKPKLQEIEIEKITNEELEEEFSFLLSEKMILSMYEDGLISLEEKTELMREIIDQFPLKLGTLML